MNVLENVQLGFHLPKQVTDKLWGRHSLYNIIMFLSIINVNVYSKEKIFTTDPLNKTEKYKSKKVLTEREPPEGEFFRPSLVH